MFLSISLDESIVYFIQTRATPNVNCKFVGAAAGYCYSNRQFEMSSISSLLIAFRLRCLLIFHISFCLLFFIFLSCSFFLSFLFVLSFFLLLILFFFISLSSSSFYSFCPLRSFFFLLLSFFTFVFFIVVIFFVCSFFYFLCIYLLPPTPVSSPPSSSLSGFSPSLLYSPRTKLLKSSFLFFRISAHQTWDQIHLNVFKYK